MIGKLKRLIAAAIDLAIAGVIPSFAMFFLSDLTLEKSFILLGILIFLLKDIRGGRSVGKKIMGIQVIGYDGDKVNNTRYILRNILSILWPLEVLVMFIDKRGRKLGDMLAKTKVIEVLNSNRQI